MACTFIVGCRQEEHHSGDTSTDLIEQLKKRIENFDDPISYCHFMDLHHKNQISTSQTNELIDFAYRHHNPVLFRPAEKTILPEQYSLNFIWLSPSAVDEKYPITGDNEERLQNNILKPLSDWQSKQPDAKINFWYDGNKVKNGSLERTKARLQQIGFVLENLRLRNLREITVVNAHHDLFAEHMPLYFRIDLAKVAIADHVLNVDKVLYVAIIDTDVGAITRRQFFDQRTLLALDSHGYIFGTAFTLEENSFVLLYNNPAIHIAKLHREEVLNPALAIGHEKLREGQPINPQSVYHRYAYFRKAVNNTRAPWNSKFGWGKNMIFPPSQFGGGGFSDTQIAALKKALVGYKGCPHGL